MTDDDIQRGLALCEAATGSWRFVMEARTLLPAALCEVQRLRGELEQARAERDKLRGLLGEALGLAAHFADVAGHPDDDVAVAGRAELARIARDGGVEP